MKTEIEYFPFANEKILRCSMPNYQDINRSLMKDLQRERDNFTYSHLINGRWENTYLPIQKVSRAREVILFSRNLVLDALGIRLLALFSPQGIIRNSPFWFNLAERGETTGVHNHVGEATFSGVYYVLAPTQSGNLFFRAEGEEDFALEPVEGNCVLFPSTLRHGVHDNLSSEVRISLAFNLFSIPFPLSSKI